jgi:beta-galactosidase/beta-glucuronidase
LLDESGRTAAQGDSCLVVNNPRLWSPETPYLYTLAGTVKKDGKTVDEIVIPVGIRTFRFDPNDGFFLNGQNTKLMGVCIHHDAGVLGAAVPKAVWARRLQKFKQAGVNAIRFSHNPPSPDLLDLCDEMGFLAIDEAFDEWEGCKNKWWHGHNVYPPKHYGYSDDFPQWHEKDIADMVKRDRNHPSIILWSIGNEIDYPNDPYVHPLFALVTGNNDANKPEQERIYDPNKPNAQRLATLACELAATVRLYDATRPVTSALSLPELSSLSLLI